MSSSAIPIPHPPVRPDPVTHAAATGAWWKIPLSAAILLLVPLPFIWHLVGVVDGPVSEGAWALIKISIGVNILIIVYHYTAPAHPKFMMIPWRRWILRTHILSGTVELVAGVAALFFTDNPAAGITMAVAALFFHIPSASLQTPIVFGVKAIMTPSYTLCIGFHAFCALNLLLHPTSTLWAANTFLVFNIYVWCRVYVYFFDALRLFGPMKYTVSILAAGCTVVPAVVGPMTTAALAVFIITYIFLNRKLFITTAGGYEDFVRERARDAALSPEMLALWNQPATAEEDERAARDFFGLLDPEGRGFVTTPEIESALVSAQLPAAALSAYLRQHVGSESLDFAQFKAHVWSVDAVRQRASRAAATRQATSERDRAELVFRQLDVDRNGQINKSMLGLLLSGWGLPEGEADRYMKHIDSNGDGLIDFDDFFNRMRPIWRFIYFEIYQAEAAQEETDMVLRQLASNKESVRARRMLKTVQEELLSRVPFLQGASEKLIADLGSSLVREEIPAGATLFAEGSSGDRFYVIETGALRVSKADDVIAVLGAGGCFGEGALLSPERRSATVVAVAHSVVLSLSRSSFDFVLERHAGVREQLEALHRQRVVIAVKRTLQGELLGRVPFLQGATGDVINALAESLQGTTVPAGGVIMTEGGPGDQFHLIESGSVEITRTGKVISQLTAGDCMGEGALISSEPRAATARALSETHLLSLTRESFDRILAAFPAVRARLVSLHQGHRENDARF